jgi:hypothetical protein
MPSIQAPDISLSLLVLISPLIQNPLTGLLPAKKCPEPSSIIAFTYGKIISKIVSKMRCHYGKLQTTLLNNRNHA